MPKEISQQLSQLQQIAFTITKDKTISVKYNPKEHTAFYEPQKNQITLTSNCFPKGIDKYPIAHAKLLDGLLTHETGHALLTNPLLDRYKRFEDSKLYKILAHHIINVIEDKRINYFMAMRYRHDLGKRLEFLLSLTKNMIEKHVSNNLEKVEANLKNAEAKKLLTILVNKGLYNADLPELEKTLTKEQKLEAKTILETLEQTKYQRVAHDLINSAETIYKIISKHIDKEDNLVQYIPILSDGELSDSLDKELEAELKEEQKKQDEKDKEDLEKQLSNGLGYGTDKGDLINSPEPNEFVYNKLVNKNQAEITELLNKLKRTVKPIVCKQIFQRKGRLMNSIISKAYTNSLRREVRNIYQSSNVTFEKQKVAMQILLDFSGSMERETALDITTILTEVFSAWLEDIAFSVLVFGTDYQKVKTFYEQSSNTKARIGNISVNASSTNCAKPLEDILKMFNGIDTKDRTKLLVIASDFSFSDSTEVKEILEHIERANIKLLFIGLCSVDNDNFLGILPNSKNVFRTIIEKPSDLPNLFLDIYTRAINALIK